MSVILNGVEIAPCICSKAKVALEIPNSYVENRKTCSQEYWNRVVEYFGSLHAKTPEQIVIAKKRIDLFRP